MRSTITGAAAMLAIMLTGPAHGADPDTIRAQAEERARTAEQVQRQQKTDREEAAAGAHKAMTAGFAMPEQWFLIWRSPASVSFMGQHAEEAKCRNAERRVNAQLRKLAWGAASCIAVPLP